MERRAGDRVGGGRAGEEQKNEQEREFDGDQTEASLNHEAQHDEHDAERVADARRVEARKEIGQAEKGRSCR